MKAISAGIRAGERVKLPDSRYLTIAVSHDSLLLLAEVKVQVGSSWFVGFKLCWRFVLSIIPGVIHIAFP